MVENNKILDNSLKIDTIEKSARDFSRCDLNRIEKVDNSNNLLSKNISNSQFKFKNMTNPKEKSDIKCRKIYICNNEKLSENNIDAKEGEEFILQC